VSKADGAYPYILPDPELSNGASTVARVEREHPSHPRDRSAGQSPEGAPVKRSWESPEKDSK